MAKWIKVGMTWDQFTDADVNGKESEWFDATTNPYSVLLKPGIVVRVDEHDGRGPRLMIVGAVNVAGGVCDDCHVAPDALVVEYLDASNAIEFAIAEADQAP